MQDVQCVGVTSDAEWGWPITPGRRVQLRVSIWDDGQDHHPPGFLGKAGDVLYVHEALGANWLGVSYCPTFQSQGSFAVKLGEVQLYWEQLDLFPQTLPTTKKEMYP